MSKSKRIRAARQRAASRPARQDGGGKIYGFTGAPWDVWLAVRADPAADDDALTVLEHVPFRLVNTEGDEFPATLAEMLDDFGDEFGGGMQEFCAGAQWLTERGHLCWNQPANTVTLTIPG